MESNCVEEPGCSIPLKQFSNEFNKFAKEKHLRLMSVRQVSKILREEGFEIGKRYFEDEKDKISKVVILNLTLNIPKTTETTESPSRFTHGVLTESVGSSGRSSISQEINFDDLRK